MHNPYPYLSTDQISDDVRQVLATFLRQLAAERGWRLPTVPYAGERSVRTPLFHSENIAVYKDDFVSGDGFADPRAALAARLEEYQPIAANLDVERRQRVDSLLADMEAATPEQLRRLASVLWPGMTVDHTNPSVQAGIERVLAAIRTNTVPKGDTSDSHSGAPDDRIYIPRDDKQTDSHHDDIAAYKNWFEASCARPLQAAIEAQLVAVRANAVLAGRMAPVDVTDSWDAVPLELTHRWRAVFGRDLRAAVEVDVGVLERLRGMLYDKEHKGIDPPTCDCGCGSVIGCVNQSR